MVNLWTYKCELKAIDPRFERGREFNRQQIPLNCEAAVPMKSEPRTLKKANLYSKRFSESQTKNLAQKRLESLNYERPPLNQYHKGIEHAVHPEFHPALNIAQPTKLQPRSRVL